MDSQIESLKEWLKKNDLNLEKNSNNNLKLIKSENECEGRCVLATRNTEPDTLLIELPTKFMINYRHSLKDELLVKFFQWCLNEKKTQLTRLEALYFYLIIQTYDNNSFLNGFIKSMPTTYDTPEYFNDTLIDNLPDYLKKPILNRLNDFKNKFNKHKQLLEEYSALNTIENTSIEILLNNYTYENLKWIFCSVNSRCFHTDETTLCNDDELNLAVKLFGDLNELKKEEKKLKINTFDDYARKLDLEQAYNNNQFCLIPYIDFLNHSFKSNAYAFFDTEKQSYQLKSKEIDEFSEDHSYLVKENQQVYITYGHHENKTLLIEYGFVLDENIYDKIIFNKNDFSKLLRKDSDYECLCREASGLKIYSDLSINKSEGPTWCLLKMLDLIACFNTMKPQSKKIKIQSDIQFSSNIKSLFIDLLIKYKKEFTESMSKLLNLNTQSYHLDMCVKYCQLQLDIIEFNLELVNDNERFKELF